MPIHRLNHAVLWVRDAQAAAEFYRSVLGFRVTFEVGGGRAVFLQAEGSTNDHDLAVMEVGATAADSRAGRGAVGLYHLAWEVDTLADLERILRALVERGALVGASDHGTTKSLYATDVDGLEFEVAWVLPADQITEADRVPATRPLDLDREIRRFGAERVGGLGISRPAGVAP